MDDMWNEILSLKGFDNPNFCISDEVTTVFKKYVYIKEENKNGKG